MSRRFIIPLLIAVFVSLMLLSCKTTGFGFKGVDVNGMIYDFSNRPVPFCDVYLGRWRRSSSDINGRFVISKVPAGTYTITGNRKGFEEYSGEVTVREKGQIIYIRLPSQNQLLNLVDEALCANNLAMAEEMAERAFQIDPNNIEMLFYYAAVKFRQRDYKKAMEFVDSAKTLGSRDQYIERFTSQLKEKVYAN